MKRHLKSNEINFNLLLEWRHSPACFREEGVSFLNNHIVPKLLEAGLPGTSQFDDMLVQFNVTQSKSLV